MQGVPCPRVTLLQIWERSVVAKRREEAKTSRSERPRRRHLDDGSFARLPPVYQTHFDGKICWWKWCAGGMKIYEIQSFEISLYWLQTTVAEKGHRKNKYIVRKKKLKMNKKYLCRDPYLISPGPDLLYWGPEIIMSGPRLIMSGTRLIMSGPRDDYVGDPTYHVGDPTYYVGARDNYVGAPTYNVGDPSYYVGTPSWLYRGPDLLCRGPKITMSGSWDNHVGAASYQNTC